MPRQHLHQEEGLEHEASSRYSAGSVTNKPRSMQLINASLGACGTLQASSVPPHSSHTVLNESGPSTQLQVRVMEVCAPAERRREETQGDELPAIAAAAAATSQSAHENGSSFLQLDCVP